jgi:hypothetical protein
MKLVLIVTVLIFSSFVGGSQGDEQTIKLSVDDGRPVAAAVLQLEENCGCVITYEDPRYVHSSEMNDVTESVRKDLDKFRPGEAPRVIVPRGGPLAVDYEALPGTKVPINTRATIEKVLNSHANAGGPGRFRLEQEGETFHVIPTDFKNSLGELTPQESPLDTVISFPAQERSAAQTLQVICNAISEQSQTSVSVATFPLNPFFRYRDVRGLQSGKARDALISLLQSVDPSGHLSWRLLGGAGTNTYYLNIHRVAPLR